MEFSLIELPLGTLFALEMSRPEECYLEYMLVIDIGDDVPTKKDP